MTPCGAYVKEPESHYTATLDSYDITREQYKRAAAASIVDYERFRRTS